MLKMFTFVISKRIITKLIKLISIVNEKKQKTPGKNREFHLGWMMGLEPTTLGTYRISFM